MRRFATIALSLLLVGSYAAWAQDEKKADDPKPAETKDQDKAKTEAKAEKAIPPEVLAKIEAARKAVAEAIVAAEDAGLVQSSIDPPPILDLLVYGVADDEVIVKAKEGGVSPEVFGAWFTGYGRTSGVAYEKEVRIYQPSKGLKALFDKRAEVFRPLIAAARKAKAEPSADEKKAADEAKAKQEAEEKKAADDKAAEEKAKKDAEEKAKKDAEEKAAAEKKAADEKAKKDAEAKKDEPKGDEPKKDEPKKDEPKGDEPKADEPK